MRQAADDEAAVAQQQGRARHDPSAPADPPGCSSSDAAMMDGQRRGAATKRVDTALRMFAAGGLAGACARTASAPLDRIKILFQVQGLPSSGTSAVAYTGVGQAARKIVLEEGVVGFWKGNLTNVMRVFPYSAFQLMANDQYKRVLAGPDGELRVWQRLTAGACAGMTATAMTHPLDTLRLRLAMPKHGYAGLTDALRQVVRHEGVSALYKGLAPTLVGIAPFAALNFAAYDLAKSWAYDQGQLPQRQEVNLVLGSMTSLFAASCCYPLDTVRRRMQMQGHVYSGQMDALSRIWLTEGVRGFYKGWLANAMKVVPQGSIRFVVYEYLKIALQIKRQRTDT